jgi:hypothetical protein
LKAILQINNIEVFIGRGLPMVCQEAKKLGKQIRFVDEGEEFKVVLEW